jgi:uncharacterized protein YndB with AHSA1/START domain
MPKPYVAKQEYFLKAPPDRVFKALTEPKTLVKWFLSKAKLDPKRGGTFTFEWFGGYRMTNKLKRIEQNRAVSFSWSDRLKNGQVAKTTAAFDLAKRGKGTLLRLRHSGFRDPEHFADCSSRWAYYLTNLKSVLDNGHDLRSKYDW